MVGGMFATQNKLGYWSVTRPFLLAKGQQRQTSVLSAPFVNTEYEARMAGEERRKKEGE